MPEQHRPPLYRPIADHLPATYREDAASFEQVEGFLGILDLLYRDYIAQLDGIGGWLTPDARHLRPPGMEPGADSREWLARYEIVFEEVARTVAFQFPPSWEDTNREAMLDRQETFLRRAPRIWRRRGTPRGFIAWMCIYFRLWTRRDRPILIEHFKYRPDDDTSGEAPDDVDEWAHRVTVLVPLSEQFLDYQRRREAVEFVERHLPAHLLPCTAWVPDDFEIDLADTDAVRELLRNLVSAVPWEDGVHLLCDVLDSRAIDRLDVGHLPTEEPRQPDHEGE